MAANNYFGFTHSGTQYTATPGAAGAAYQAPGGYAVAPTAASTPAATYTAQRAATGYEYSAGTTAYAAPTAASATTYDYSSYARTAAVAQAYDTNKTYYQQPVASAASYSTPDYSGWTQASSAQKPTPAVSAVYTYSQPGQRAAQPAKPATALGGGAAGYSATTYGAPGAVGSGANAYGTNAGTGYGAVSQNKFTAAGSTAAASQLKKPAAPQTSYSGVATLGYNSSYVSQAGGATGSYSYSGNKAPVTNVQSTPKTTGLGSGIRTNVGGSNTGGTGAGSTYTSSYDQALYNAALYQTGAASGGGANQNNKPVWKNYNKGGANAAGGTNNNFTKFQRPKLPPKPQQIHYCEVCKISCAGPLTYKEHLEGSRHKKKEQAQKAATTAPESTSTKSGHGPAAHRGTSFKCDLCSVTCTGTDAYSAHLRGVKHQKVVKLHQKLGKPIPEPDPKATAILRAKAEALEAAKAAAAAGGASDAAAKGVKQAPKINYVAGAPLGGKPGGDSASSTAASEKSSEDIDMIVDEHILPVGEEFVEEIKGDDGKLQTFHCKLCDCKFNDPNAKDMHMKGKRHRLAYKKKVDPSLVVEIKPNYFQKKQKEQRERMRMDYARRREEERVNFWTDKLLDEERRYWEEMRRYEEEMEYYEWNMVAHARRMPPPPPPHGAPRPMLPPPPHMMRGPHRIETFEDRHVIAKSIAIAPSPAQLHDLSSCVDSVEKALKNVSDILVDAVIAAEVATGGKSAVVVKSEATDDKKESEDKKKDNLKSLKEKEEKRVLKGVNRVSALAKNILLKDEMSAELVVLCAEKPTLTLLRQVIQHLPEQLKQVAPNDTFEVDIKPSEAGFLVTRAKKVKSATATAAEEVKPAEEGTVASDANVPIVINVVLTSPIIREEMLEKQIAKAKAEAEAKKIATEGAAATPTPIKQEAPETPKPVKPEPKDLLSAQKCLDALANLRHAKWFQAKAEPLQSCQMVIRVLRHTGQAWNLLTPWALELLVEKVLVSAGMPLSPGDALRRVLEAVSSGLLLQAGPGLMDPCEKDPIDALGEMPAQDREDLTVAAQIGLRQMAFHQVFKFLQMEPVKFKKGFGGGRNATRKRRRDTSSGEKDENGIKKDKKEDEEGGVAVKQETMETK